MKSVTQTAYDEGAPLHAVEREQTGITHAEIGAYLLSLWGMPYPVVEAVLHHHEPWRSDSQNFGPVAVVHVTNALAHECESGSQTAPQDCLDLAYLGSLDIAENLMEWRAIARGLAVAAPAEGPQGSAVR
jgi:HD-like signal output (HDOD) protein